MKLKALIVSAVTSAALLVPIATASAHSGSSWSWSPGAAVESVVYQDLIVGGELIDATYAECVGKGKRFDGRFKHFICYVESDQYVPFMIKVHVTGEYDFRWDYLGDY